jgi:hypothetical protein
MKKQVIERYEKYPKYTALTCTWMSCTGNVLAVDRKWAGQVSERRQKRGDESAKEKIKAREAC